MEKCDTQTIGPVNPASQSDAWNCLAADEERYTSPRTRERLSHCQTAQLASFGACGGSVFSGVWAGRTATNRRNTIRSIDRPGGTVKGSRGTDDRSILRRTKRTRLSHRIRNTSSREKHQYYSSHRRVSPKKRRRRVRVAHDRYDCRMQVTVRHRIHSRQRIRAMCRTVASSQFDVDRRPHVSRRLLGNLGVSEGSAPLGD
ncbi:hypothetical protein Enr13x_09290 [Stieleria neptunia]|uniref:Uncharacterized protein n=1 Tax=Stieleria neptunia TaxID=2527979 RepID=A0A518HJT9_9BACT|nr:hypothetical protein Enr13x_09290 [Stieleria neptunia]